MTPSLLRGAALGAGIALGFAGCHGGSPSGNIVAGPVPLAWSMLSPRSPTPTARDAHSAVLDVANDRMIVFGGEEQPGNPPPLLDETWVLSGASGAGATAAWTQLSPIGVTPSARGYHGAIYDAASNRMVVIAGNPNVGFCAGAVDDVWVLEHANGLGGTPAWSAESPTGTPPGMRDRLTTVYDAGGDRAIIFGGVIPCGATYADVIVLSNATGLGGTPAWTALTPGGTPIPGRFDHTAVYDAGDDRMIVFGGLVGAMESGATPEDDVWVLTGASGAGAAPAWIELHPSGAPPGGRYGASAIYDAAGNRMIIFGGQVAGPGGNDVWALSNANGLGGAPAWTELSPGGGPPSQRGQQSAVFSSASGTMTIFGGITPGSVSVGDVWVLTGL